MLIADPAPEAGTSGILRVAVEANRPPFQFYDHGSLTGFNIELFAKIAEVLGLSITFVPMPNQAALTALANGSIDLILGYPYDPGLTDRLLFSEPLAVSSLGVLIPAQSDLFRDSLTDIAGSVVALTRETGAYNLLKHIRTIRFNETRSAADALKLLELARADVVLEDRLVLSYLMKQAGSSRQFRFAASYWLPVEYCLAAGKSNNYLTWRLNTGLAAIKERGQYGAVYATWFNNAEFDAQRRLQRFLTGFVFSLLGFLAILALGFWWNRQLAVRVRAGTAELRKLNQDLQVQMAETADKNQFIKQILESSPRGIITLNADGVVSSSNKRAVEIGRFAADPVGMEWNSLPLLSKMVRDRFDSVRKEGRRYLFESLTWEPDELSRMHLRYNLYPLLDHDRKPAGLICTYEDYTAEKLLRDQIFEREKTAALSRIVAGMAHEIRNPLTSIKTFVELLPRKLDNPNFRKELLELVPREIERVDQLISNLIDFAKPRPANNTRVDLSEVTRSCVAVLLPMVEKRGATVRLEAERELCARIDPDHYRQSLINFVINALDALEEKQLGGSRKLSAEESTIHIRLYAINKKLRLEIRDHGVGIGTEELDRVFEPFYTTKAKGIGLGLPLTRQFVQENGGTLTLESEAGIGTLITVDFPEEQDS